MRPPTEAARRLSRLIAQDGSVPISLFMAYANAEYYATRDPLGAPGDFITAPEISQMFGELIGLWCADLWMRAGQPQPIAWVELGGGRGTLGADALRAMKQFGLEPEVHLVETSPVLRDLQSAAMPGAQFHDDVASLPVDRPLIIIANEFFDALPARQLVKTDRGWRERVVIHTAAGFGDAAGDQAMDAAVPPQWAGEPVGTVLESSPATRAIAGDIARAIVTQGGALLAIDYGYAATTPGDTLQAVVRHRYADIFADVGAQDLTVHVDFSALAAACRAEGARVSGPVEQGAFLQSLGLESRAQSLMAGHPHRASAIAAERDRLAGEDQMGRLFKVLACCAPQWPAPEGLSA